MKKIGFLTSEIHPELIDDDLVVLPFLRDRDIEAKPVVWDRATDLQLKQFDGFVFRSCWNYHVKFPEYKIFLNRLRGLGIPCHNPLDVVVWNLNKSHIIEFEKLNFNGQIPVPKTKYYQTGRSISETDIETRSTNDFLVVKPAVSLNGFETYLLPTENIKKIVDTVNRLLQDRDVLIQDYVPEIKSTGEVSLIYFNGKFSHAIRKLAAPGEFRIHQEHGGTRQPMQPSQQAIEFGDAILKQVKQKLLYARVDYVESKNGPLMIELEVTDPMLFLLADSQAPARFADAINEVFR